MNQQEFLIDKRFKEMFQLGMDPQVASDWYKAEHQKLIDERKAQEAVAARADRFQDSHSERKCRTCNVTLPVHLGRGRPSVFCDKDRPTK